MVKATSICRGQLPEQLSYTAGSVSKRARLDTTRVGSVASMRYGRTKEECLRDVGNEDRCRYFYTGRIRGRVSGARSSAGPTE